MNLLTFPEIDLHQNESLIEKIENKIETWLKAGDSSKLVFVKGEAGCGKTTFLKKLKQKLIQKGIIAFYSNPDPLRDSIEPFSFVIDSLDLDYTRSDYHIFPCLYDVEPLKKWFNLLDLKADDFIFFDSEKKYVIDSYVKCLVMTLKRYLSNGQIPVFLIDNYDMGQELIYRVTRYFILNNNYSAFRFIFICTGNEVPEFLSDFEDIEHFQLKKPLKYDYYDHFKDRNVIESIYEATGGVTTDIFNSLKELYSKGEVQFRNNLFESSTVPYNPDLLPNPETSLENQLLSLNSMEIEMIKFALVSGKQFECESVAFLSQNSAKVAKDALNSICSKSYLIYKNGSKYFFSSDTLYFRLLDYLHSESTYNRVVDLIERKFKHKTLLSDFSLANLYLYCCIKAKKIYKFIRYSFEIGRNCLDQFGYTKAIFLYRKIFEYDQEIKADSKRKMEIIGKTMLDSGRINYYCGYWDEALNYYNKAHELFDRLQNNKLIFDVIYSLVELYMRIDQIDKCAPLLKKIRVIALDREDNYMLIVFFNLYGEFYYRKRNYVEAERIFSTIYKDYVDRRNYKSIRKEFNKTLRGLGKLAYCKGDYSTSVEYYENSLKCNFEEQSPYDKVDTYHRLGISSLKIGNTDRSFIYFAYAFMEISRSEDIFLMNKIMISLGVAHMVNADFDIAESVFKKSIAINECLNNTKGKIIAYQNLAQIYFYKGNEKNLQNYFRRGIVLAKKFDDNFGIASLNQTMGKYYLVTGDYPKAGACFSEALKSAQSFKKHEVYIISLCYYTISCYYTGTSEDMIKGKEEISSLVSELQDNYLINLIYLTVLYYELKKGNLSIINVLLRKVEFYLKDYYGGLELVKLYYDLSKIKGMDREYIALECRNILQKNPNALFQKMMEDIK